MTSRDQKCKYCRSVSVICFWGDLPERAWKRPALLLITALMALIIGLIAWVQAETMDKWELFGVAAFIAICAIVASVGLFACDRCVARVLGNST